MPANDFGYPVTQCPSDPTKARINTVGDGNCGLRAAIQGLLIRGITQDKQEFVADFLQGIYDRNKNGVDGEGKSLYASNITKDANPVIESLQKANVLKLLQTYKNKTPTDLPKLRNDYFGIEGSYNAVAEMDHVIYVLAGCLRLDISKYITDNLAGSRAFELDEGLDDLNTLGKETEFQDTLAYFANHKISSSMESDNPQIGTQNLDSIKQHLADNNRFKEPEIAISIYHVNGNHYETLVDEEIDSVRVAKNLFDTKRRPSPTSVTEYNDALIGLQGQLDGTPAGHSVTRIMGESEKEKKNGSISIEKLTQGLLIVKDVVTNPIEMEGLKAMAKYEKTLPSKSAIKREYQILLVVTAVVLVVAAAVALAVFTGGLSLPVSMAAIAGVFSAVGPALGVAGAAVPGLASAGFAAASSLGSAALAAAPGLGSAGLAAASSLGSAGLAAAPGLGSAVLATEGVKEGVALTAAVVLNRESMRSRPPLTSMPSTERILNSLPSGSKSTPVVDAQTKVADENLSLTQPGKTG